MYEEHIVLWSSIISLLLALLRLVAISSSFKIPDMSNDTNLTHRAAEKPPAPSRAGEVSSVRIPYSVLSFFRSKTGPDHGL